MLSKWLNLFKYIGICVGVGLLGSVFTMKSIPTWYDKLNKPSITPPSWIFGPVWTLLYTLMGISASIISQKKEQGKKVAMTIFYLQLILNYLWTAFFFGMHSPFAALIEIFILWIFIVVTILLFWKLSPVAALLLVPYLLWTSFASVLNFLFWKINR